MRLDHLLLRHGNRSCQTSAQVTCIQRTATRKGPCPLIFLSINGALAQLGEHLLCKQGVVGSIPTGSTTKRDTLGL